MITQKGPITKEETELEIKIVPMPNAYLVQVSSDVFRGMFVMDRGFDHEEMTELTDKIFSFIEELSMRTFGDDDEIPQ